MSIPDEAFDAATKRVQAETLGAAWSRDIARLAVEAAAPFIAARALRDTADITPVAWDFGPGVSAVQIRPWLRNLADQTEARK